jgi:hypothetical protein
MKLNFTKLTLLSITLAASLFAADTPKPAADDSKPLPRESQLAFEALAQREREATKRVDAVYEMLITPLKAEQSAEVKRACELVGFKPIGDDGKPACEVRDGKVVRIPSTPPSKVAGASGGGK